jgi:putative addiction module component (TIGR02574 family)
MIFCMAAPKIDYSQLTAAERLALIGELGDSLGNDDVPVDPALEAELARRAAASAAAPGTGKPWADVRDRLLRQL